MPTPEWLSRVFEADDRSRDAIRRRTPVVTKKYDTGLIYKTRDGAPQPAQQQQTTMDDQTQKVWDKYVDGRILAMFDPDGGKMGEVIAEVISLLRAELREEFTKKLDHNRRQLMINNYEIASLRRQRGEIKQLRGSVNRKRNGA